MVEPLERSSLGYRAGVRTGPREGLACKRGKPLAPSRPAILGILCPGRRQPAQSLLLSGLVQPPSLLGELPPLQSQEPEPGRLASRPHPDGSAPLACV